MTTFSYVQDQVIKKARELFPNSLRDQAHFVSLVNQESGFNPTAHATKNEDSQGLFQFGKELRDKFNVSKQSSVPDQIIAGSEYISELYRKHKGNWHDILGEYNLGIPSYNKMKLGGTSVPISRFNSEYLPNLMRRVSEYLGADSSPRENITLGEPLVANSRDPVAPDNPSNPFSAPNPYAKKTFSNEEKYQAGSLFGRLLSMALNR